MAETARRERLLTTSVGPTPATVPRARLFAAAGDRTQEWQSSVSPRYERLTRAIAQSLMGAYLAGSNARRITGALARRSDRSGP
jgi:hypothetical protein